MRTSIEVEGLTELRQRLRGIPDELDRQQRPVMHRAVIMLGDEVRSRVYSPAGRAKAGIVDSESGYGATLKGLIKARGKAAKHSIRGRHPGKQPKIGTVRRFMARSGRPVSRSAAFLIARAIGRRGMKGHPVMEEALAARQTQVVSMFFEWVQRALRGR